jgi:hypothetical protein
MDDLIKRCDVLENIDESADLLRTVLDEMDLVGIEREKFGYGLGLLEALIDDIKQMPSAESEITRCKDCKNSEHWYRDRRRCFLWSEDGVTVFDDGFCNYAERREE